MPRVKPEANEFYHIYNRGVDKRNIFGDIFDISRFLTSLEAFNSEENTESIYSQYKTEKQTLRSPTSQNRSHFKKTQSNKKIIELHAYHLLGNHFHLLLKELETHGVSTFMQRLGTGYTKYFNEKYDRSGSLFQGKYKIAHINTDEKYNYTFAYVTYNNIVHSSHFNFPVPERINQLCSSGHQLENNTLGLCNLSAIPQGFKRKAFFREAKKNAKQIYAVREEEKYLLE